jgi:TonB-dependent receptor
VFPVGTTNAVTMPSQSFPFDPELTDRMLHGGNYFQRELDETNLTASLNFAWDIVDHTRLRFDAQHIQRDANTEFSRTTINFTPTTTSGLIQAPIEELGGEVRPRRFYNNFQRTMGIVARDIETEATTLSLRGDTAIDRWQFSYKAGTSRAVSRTENLSLSLITTLSSDLVNVIDPETIQLVNDANNIQRVAGGGARFAGDNVVVMNLSEEGRNRLFDPALYELFSGTLSHTNDPTDAVIAEGSSRYSFGTGVVDYIQVGGKYDRSERTSLHSTFATDVAGILASESYVRVFGNGAFLPELGVTSLPMRDLGVVGAHGHTIPYISLADARQIYGELPALAAAGRYNLTDRTGLDPILDTGAANPTRTLEDRYSGYVESLLRFGRLEIAGGARYESVHRSGGSVSLPTFTFPDGTLVPRENLLAAELIDFVEASGTQDNWTPSVLATWRHNEQLVARFGYFRSTINPNFRLLRQRPQFSVNLNPSAVPAFQRGLIREGNPDLRPSTTDNYDLDVAYYFRDRPGLVRLAFFFKDISNNFTSVLLADRPADVRDRLVEYFSPLEEFYPGISDLPAASEFSYQLNRPINGEGGTIWGLEGEVIRQLDFLPGFLSDFGVLFNLTYTTGDFPTLVNARDENSQQFSLSLDRPLAEQSRWAGTASINYERGPFSGRVLYTYQSVSVDAYSPSDLNDVTPKFSTLDLRADYQLQRLGGRFSFYLQGDDLLRTRHDADIRSAVASTYGLSDASFFFPTTSQFRGGRTFTLGMKVTF